MASSDPYSRAHLVGQGFILSVCSSITISKGHGFDANCGHLLMFLHMGKGFVVIDAEV